MGDVRQNGKSHLTRCIQAANIAVLSDAELLRAIAKVFANGDPVGNVTASRLLSIAATCEAIEEAGNDRSV